MNLSEHFTIEEMIASDTAKANRIDNTPPTEAIINMTILAQRVLEPARQLLGAPITITSGYRCNDLNYRVGGKPTSQHTIGQAADLQCRDLPRLFDILSKMDFDQLLYERNSKGTQWIHISYTLTSNRHYLNNNYKA